MKSKRLLALASFIVKENRVVDIGCDHAYLPIYLVENHLCKRVIASDVSAKVLKSARKNIQLKKLDNEIPIVLSNGLEKINQREVDTLVLAGMGTSLILKMLKSVEKKYIKKIIVQSNNDLYLLRVSMQKLGYYLQEEKVVYEKGHYYVVGLYTQIVWKRTKRELYFGLYKPENVEYYQSMYHSLKKIYSKIGLRHFKEKSCLLYQVYLLRNYL